MSGTIDANGITLTGDGFGVNWVRKQLSAAPAVAMKMQFVYRMYFTDAAATSVNYTSKGWDSCAFFGLDFNDTIYDFSGGDTITPPGFYGPILTSKPASAGPVYDNSFKQYRTSLQTHYRATPWASDGSGRIQTGGFWDGNGAALISNSVGWIDTTFNGLDAQMSWPYSAANGAIYTYMWEVWGSLVDKSVYSRAIIVNGSLAEGDTMFTAMDAAALGSGAGQINEYTIHGNVTSNWRNSDDTMNFPRWLKLKNPLPEYSLQLKYYKVRFLDATDTVIS